MIKQLNYFSTAIIFIIISCFPKAVIAQQNEIYFTPDKLINAQLHAGSGDQLQVFGVTTNDQGLVINPHLEEGWTWSAVRNLEYQGQSITYFFVDGWLYTNLAIYTSHRRMKFQKEVSNLVHGDIFLIAFYSEKYIEKELAIFIASEKETKGELIIDRKLWGEEKRIPYELNAGEGKLISVMKMSDEFRPKFIAHPEVGTQNISLNGQWDFTLGEVEQGYLEQHSDKPWNKISVPHCWNVEDVHDQRNEFDGYEIFPSYYRGSAWYQKTFSLSEDLKNKKIVVEFEGAFQVADVWLNEEYLGQHIGGYTGFSYEISDKVRYGEKANLLAVKVDNSYNYDIPPHTADYIMYGGLYRDVRLNISNKLSVEDIYISTPQVSDNSAIAKIITTLRNDSKNSFQVQLLTNIVNNAGEIVSTIKTNKTISAKTVRVIDQTTEDIVSPYLWNPDEPYLYSVYSTLIVDGKHVHEKQTLFGFRWYSFDPDEGFFLNGKHLKLKGVCKPQDYAGLGIAVPDSLQIKDIQMIKEMGANFIRLSHYPHDPAVLNACDRLGLLVWAEIPIVNTVGGEKFTLNAKQIMREMVRRDRNHPSIILWGITNESAMPFTNEEQIEHVVNVLEEVNKVAKKEDPTRLTVQAHNHLENKHISEITDVVGRNRYFGWYQGEFDDFEKVMIEEHKENPEWNIIISEYGVGAKLGYHLDNPKRFDFSEEYQLDFHEYYWKFIKEHSWIAGSAVWVAFDFGSSVKRGNIPRINQKGIWDMTRQPKDLYYFYKSQWTDDPMVHIVSHTRRFYNGLQGDYKTIRVFSNCERVELFLNGQSLGFKQNQYVFRWEVSFKAGKNNLKAVALKGNEIVEDWINVIYLPNDAQ